MDTTEQTPPQSSIHVGCEIEAALQDALGLLKRWRNLCERDIARAEAQPQAPAPPLTDLTRYTLCLRRLLDTNERAKDQIRKFHVHRFTQDDIDEFIERDKKYGWEPGDYSSDLKPPTAPQEIARIYTPPVVSALSERSESNGPAASASAPVYPPSSPAPSDPSAPSDSSIPSIPSIMSIPSISSDPSDPASPSDPPSSPAPTSPSFSSYPTYPSDLSSLSDLSAPSLDPYPAYQPKVLPRASPTRSHR